MERVTWLVCWWCYQTPYRATFDNEVGAEACAKVNNGFLIRISGRGIVVERVEDWYRRDDQGRPMPARQQSWKA